MLAGWGWSMRGRGIEGDREGEGGKESEKECSDDAVMEKEGEEEEAAGAMRDRELAVSNWVPEGGRQRKSMVRRQEKPNRRRAEKRHQKGRALG